MSFGLGTASLGWKNYSSHAAAEMPQYLHVHYSHQCQWKGDFLEVECFCSAGLLRYLRFAHVSMQCW